MCVSTTELTYSAQPGQIIVNSLARAPLTLDSTITALTLNFSNTNPFDRGSEIVIKIPFDQAIYVSSSTLSCLKVIEGQDVSQPCSLQSFSATDSSIITEEWCTTSSVQVCAAGSSNILRITSGYRNPSFVVSSAKSISIFTKVRGVDAYFDSLEQGGFFQSLSFFAPSILKFVKSGSNQVGKFSVYDIQVEYTRYTSTNDGRTVLFFPREALGFDNNQKVQCFFVDNSGAEIVKADCTYELYDMETSYYKWISIGNICSQGCNYDVSKFIRIRLKNIRNPISEKPVSTQNINNNGFFGLDLLTLAGDKIISSSTQDVTGLGTLKYALTNIPSVLLKNLVVGDKSTYEISVILDVEIPSVSSAGRIEVLFPTEIAMDYGGITNCGATLKSNTQTYNLICDVDPLNKKMMRVSHSLSSNLLLRGEILNYIILYLSMVIFVLVV